MIGRKQTQRIVFHREVDSCPRSVSISNQGTIDQKKCIIATIKVAKEQTRSHNVYPIKKNEVGEKVSKMVFYCIEVVKVTFRISYAKRDKQCSILRGITLLCRKRIVLGGKYVPERYNDYKCFRLILTTNLIQGFRCKLKDTYQSKVSQSALMF